MEASAIASYNVGLSTREMVVSRKPANEAVPNSGARIRGNGAADCSFVYFTNPL